MNVLLVAATEAEVEPLKARLPLSAIQCSLHLLVTGPGMVATTYGLTRQLAGCSYDLVINAGIAGTFDPAIQKGDVVAVIKDSFSELGAEDGENFLPMRTLGMEGGEELNATGMHLLPSVIQLPEVSGITVNTVHGANASIQSVLSRTSAQVETMEGAACFYVCKKEDVPCVQLRAISNRVERRNREAWDIPTAIQNLNEQLYSLIQQLS